MSNRNYFIPAVTGIVIYLGITLIILSLTVSMNDGHLIYDLDDPYIHMAIAKNMVQHGVWGINSDQFTSSSSSPLWTSLLTGMYYLFGVKNVIPLLMNIFFGTASVLVINHYLYKHSIKPLYSSVLIVFIIFAAPFIFITFTGMEHLMHIFFSVWFVFVALDAITKDKSVSRDIGLLILSMFVSSARYEGLFIVFAVCLFLFFYKKRWVYTIILGITALLPSIAYGLYSLTKGWFFLPNSVYLKGNEPNLLSLKGIVKSLGYDAMQHFIKYPEFIVLTSAAIVLFIIYYSRSGYKFTRYTILSGLFLFICIVHMQYSYVLEIHRYTAYIMTLGTMSVLLITTDINYSFNGSKIFDITKENFRRKRVILIALTLFLIVLILSPFFYRAGRSILFTTYGTKNIYEQQYQMSRFLDRYYSNEKVGANDIGFINYNSDIICYDLWGLGNYDILRNIKKGNFTPEMLARLTKQNDVKTAVIYDSWFIKYAGGVPSEWEKAGSWIIRNNYICGDAMVSFYAVDEGEINKLIKNLKEFSDELPESVSQTGLYTKKNEKE